MSLLANPAQAFELPASIRTNGQFMMIWIQVVLLAAALQLLLMLVQNRRTKLKADQEGTSSIPIFGFRFFFKMVGDLITRPTLTDYEWQLDCTTKFGDTFGVEQPSITCAKVLMTKDPNLIRKVMTSPAWSDKVPSYCSHFKSTFDKELGLLFNNGESYKRMIRLTLKILHQFEFFKPSKVEGLASFEIEELEGLLGQEIDATAGGELTLSTRGMFQTATLNVVWQIMSGKRFSQHDPLLLPVLDAINTANREWSGMFSFAEILPFLRNFPRLTYIGSFIDCSNVLYKMLRGQIAEKRQQGMCSSYPKDFLEAFLLELDRNHGKDQYATEENLLVVLRDMVFAGVDTTNATLEFGFFYVSLHTDIQRNVQAEIDAIIGKSRAPLFADRASMPYTHAVLLETLRLASTVPVTSRTASHESTVGGHTFLKGTFFPINVYAMNRDESVWEQPKKFIPERFLSKDGKSVINADKMIPFGYGKRSCTGEPVANMMLFIFFVTLLQKYQFRISDSHPPPDLEKNMPGMSRCPVHHYVKVCRRPC